MIQLQEVAIKETLWIEFDKNGERWFKVCSSGGWSEWPKTNLKHWCRICGRPESNSLVEPIRSGLNRDMLCYSCSFWWDKFADYENPKRAFINGGAWILGSQGKGVSAQHRGCSGREAIIKFHDGRRIVTVDLWLNGYIPSYFRHLIPDNASFVSQDDSGEKS